MTRVRVMFAMLVLATGCDCSSVHERFDSGHDANADVGAVNDATVDSGVDDAGVDAAEFVDAGRDTGVDDAGVDASLAFDAAVDGGAIVDAGLDAAIDAADVDAAFDSGVDASTKVDASIDGGPVADTNLDAATDDAGVDDAGDAQTPDAGNACSGTTVCTVDYPCQVLAPSYTCRGQFPDWPVSSPSSFIDNGDGTVTDTRSGLLWQQAIGGVYDHFTASARCSWLSLAGTGWRLPTIAELESIIDDTRFDPAIDPVAFPNTLGIAFWSSSRAPGFGDRRWRVDFFDGFSGLVDLNDPSATTSLAFRCVRSSAPVVGSTGSGGAPPDRYTYPASGTVYDIRTQLTWQQTVPTGSFSQSEGIAYCADLSLDGTGWRLPSRAEMLTLRNPTLYNPAIDPVAFPSSPDTRFWTSSPYHNSSTTGWFVTFGLAGTSSIRSDYNAARIRCVR